MKLAGVFLLCIFYLSAVSQQLPQYTQYMINKYGQNPAYGGLERSLSVFTSFRDQNDAFPGNPQTFYAGTDMPFYLWNGALGFTFYNQKTGAFSNTDLKFSYNYVTGTRAGFLSFGARVGVNFLSVNGSSILTPDGNYEGVIGARVGVNFLSVNGSSILTPDGNYEGVINHNDPVLDPAAFNGLGLSWEAGVYFMGSRVEGGLVVHDLPTHSYGVGDASYSKAFSVSLFGQYKTTILDDIKLYPSMMVRADADAAVVQTDIGCVGYYRDEIIGGLNFRGFSPGSIDALGIIVGTGIGKNYRLIYSYDIGLSGLRKYHQGSHEITLSYNLKKLIGMGLPPRIIYNPRDL